MEQGLLTSGYIILLSRVGERVAADMRKTLFASLLRYNPSLSLQNEYSDPVTAGHQTGCNFIIMIPTHVGKKNLLYLICFRQDVAFFDANKTGQLVNRLTADIQEFKSSFKLVISQVWTAAFAPQVHCYAVSLHMPSFHSFTHLQGLRSVTQTAGCFVSLYIISPKLTGLTVVVLPCLVGAGALIGAFLRKLSRLAQEQVMRKCDISLIWHLLSLLFTNVFIITWLLWLLWVIRYYSQN